MLDLDAPGRFPEVDMHGTLAQMDEFPQQCAEGWRIAQDIRLPNGYGEVDQVVVCGLGGSGIGGELLRTLLLPECRVPVIVHRDYGVPAFVNKRTLVLVCSHSGTTEEVLSAFGAAQRAGAAIACVTSGGTLEQRAKETGIPVFRYVFGGWPRAALGYSLMGQLGLVQAAGLLADQSAAVAEAVQVMTDWQAELTAHVPVERNVAKQMARSLYGRIAVVYGAEHLGEVARRWKGQINENSKSAAVSDLLPEANHNSVVGYELPAEQQRWLHYVLLDSSSYHPRVAPRIELTRELLEKGGIPCSVVKARGKSRLAQMLGVAHFVDYVSYFLAMLYETDPWSIASIQLVKEYMSKL